MTHLGTFRKARAVPPTDLLTRFLVTGYLAVAVCCAGAVYRINEVSKIQTQEDRV